MGNEQLGIDDAKANGEPSEPAVAGHTPQGGVTEARRDGEQDELARLRRELLRARQELEELRAEREQSLMQMCEVNERLVIASVQADELAERAQAGRQRAEALSTRLAANEAAARVSEGQFRTIANTVPMLAWYAHPSGEIAWFNDRCYEYTGGSFVELAGWKWESVLDPADAPRVLAGWRAALKSGKPWEDTFRLRRHDGELRWFLSRALPLHDADGRVVRWFGTNVDVDAQKRAEARSHAASRAKDEFLAILGHELRNPLAPILTALDLMKTGAASPFPRELMIIERQVRHMVRLVDDLLDVSRITGGKVELALEAVELTEVVDRAIEMVSPLIEAKAHHLSVNVATSGLTVTGDPVRLSQVVTNLLTNAAKYTPSHGAIDISAAREGAKVSLRIRDSGVGISAEMLPRVFELFSQERQTLARSGGGLGLGLAIVKSLVEMHGGTITARSEGPGKGSELVLELPAHDRERAGDRAPAARLDRPGADVQTSAQNVLIVDDNGDAAEVVATLLRTHGYEVRVALDGPAALAIVDHFAPDVALLDIGLPVMDGYELAQRLQARFAPRRVSLIAITGYGREDDRRRAREAGFDLHLVKPVDFRRIQSAIGQVTASRTPLPP
jgi:PAS domain S-box-containing protein